MKIQKLNADRQLNELKDDEGGANHSRVVSPAQPEQSEFITVAYHIRANDNSPRMRLTRGSWLGLVGPEAYHLPNTWPIFMCFRCLIRLFLKLFSDDAVTVSSSRLFHGFITRSEKKMLS